MEKNKYIYIKETGQAAGPLQMEGPKFYNQVQYEIDCEIWNKHLRTLPRIDIVGEPIFTDRQILEEGKDIEVRPDIYLPESYDEYLEAINEQVRELPQRVTYVAIPLKQTGITN